MIRECKLCGLEILENEEILSYAHFIDDPKDEFYIYSDSSFHKSCFQIWSKREKFQKKFNQFIEESQRIHESNTGQKIDANELIQELLKRQKK